MLLHSAIDRLAKAAGAKFGRECFAPCALLKRQNILRGRFEVRSATGSVKRLQSVELPLPVSLALGYAHLAPKEQIRVDLEGRSLILWPPEELIELQVGYRWHGFNGRSMREWDDKFVVFAEDGGDPLAMQIDACTGLQNHDRSCITEPVFRSRRGEGRHAFSEVGPDLATFYEALAFCLESPKSQRPISNEASAVLKRLTTFEL